ncbi:uncharacterized protein LOC116290382 [Actinia tenebrosa]|uniref:Uncharacterized protein LOC116290382 n=1 Tax=Actinia tenebrosa TaxID=6105 RepID=A0A6P8HKP2_ACTTE|nr:uncharacterized protein LOC116290382 [Actinia tenebrosa]
MLLLIYFRRTLSQLYNDKWDNNWKDILPKAPEKPSDETGVWRLIDDASDWKDISENVAKIPKLRQRHCCHSSERKSGKKRCHDNFKKLMILFKNKERRNLIKTNEKINPLLQEKTAKVMVDKSVQTDEDANDGLFLVIL